MKLYYESSTIKNKKIKPIIIVEYENGNEIDILSKGVLFKDTSKKTTKAYLSFDYGLFECLSPSDIEILDVMYQVSGEKINANIWESIMLTSGIELPAIKKKYSNPLDFAKNNSYNEIEDLLKIKSFYYNNTYINRSGEATYFKHEDIAKIQISAISFIDELNEDIHESYDGKYKKNQYPREIIEIECSDTTELLYSFLDCLLNDKAPYTIRRCKHCEKYFITTQSTTSKYCTRLNNKLNMTCKQIHDKERSKESYKNMDKLETLEKKIRSLFYPDNIPDKKRQEILDKRKKFLKENKEMKKALSPRDYKDWLLSHYAKESTRKENDFEM